jgi:hypothetical protein
VTDFSAPACRTSVALQHYALLGKTGEVMIELVTIVFSALSIGFVAGYGVRAEISRRRHMRRNLQ